MRIAKSPSELGFNRYDEPRLAKALERATDKRFFQRLQAVLLVAQGLTADEVAVIESVSAQAVYNWVYRYLDQHQVASLQDLPRMLESCRKCGAIRSNSVIERRPGQLNSWPII